MTMQRRTIISITIVAALAMFAAIGLVTVNAQGPDGNNPPCDYS